MSVRVIATGGQIDLNYNAVHGRCAYDGTHVREMLDAMHFPGVELVDLSMGDSSPLSMRQQDEIIGAVMASPEDSLMITMDTRNLIPTALRVGQVLAERGVRKTVTNTGSFYPWNFGDRREVALANVATAFVAAQHLPSGSYISMAGETYPPEDFVLDWDPENHSVRGDGKPLYGEHLIREMQARIDDLTPTPHPLSARKVGREAQDQSQNQLRAQSFRRPDVSRQTGQHQQQQQQQQ